MLPGVGIFGSDPVTKVLIQILKHFDFDINAIWTNYYELEQTASMTTTTQQHPHNSNNNNNNRKVVSTNEAATNAVVVGASRLPLNKLITTSIDNVLLNKSVNLIFVCCQPNLHSQISTKALGLVCFYCFLLVWQRFHNKKFLKKRTDVICSQTFS
jgi:hypothetical protein